MELSVKKLRQAAVTLSCTGDHGSRCIQQALQLVCRDENSSTVVNMGGREFVDECRYRITVE